MRNYLKKWFQPTRLEYYSALILVSISFCSFFLPSFFPLIFDEQVRVDFEDFRLEIELFLKENKPQKAIAAIYKRSKRAVKKEVNFSLFSFNPNEATLEDFIQLGLSKRVAKTIVNYRNKGGKFYKPDDLSKIYGLRKEDFQRLKPHIVLENEPKKPKAVLAQNQLFEEEGIAKKTTQKIIPKEDKMSENFFVDINHASAEEWKKLKGIGEYFSKKIIKFRDALGGFSSVEQIAETYNLPDSTYQSIKPFLKPSPIIKKIKINSASAEELKGHPYLKWKQANGIVNYRKNHGAFENIDQLRKVGGALTLEVLNKIEPYLEFD